MTLILKGGYVLRIYLGWNANKQEIWEII